MPANRRPVFTLRFHNPQTYRMLRLIAEQRRVSMNDLAEEALEEHLSREAIAIEDRLGAALDIVRQYRSEHLKRDIEAFAHAEVTEEDPLQSRGVMPGEDRFGVRKAFVRSVE